MLRQPPKKRERDLRLGAVDDEAYRRYTFINLPHAKTVAERIERMLEALGAHDAAGNGDHSELGERLAELGRQLAPFVDDPGPDDALRAADQVARAARALVDAIERAGLRHERLGQHVRNLFECLGLQQEGAVLSIRCGESPDSPMR
jgi:hypothetical protein